MANELILYDPEKPIAHYERARAMYEKVKKSLSFGTVMPIIAFLCGCVSVLSAASDSVPRLIAYMSLFSIPFTLLSILGCKVRRAMLCLISVPLALGAALVAAFAGTFLSVPGCAAYIFAAAAEIAAISSINTFAKLKELPGFPFFDPSMEDLSFAAKERHGADEFIEGELVEEKTMKRFRPEELEPSQEMGEIITGVSLLKEGGANDGVSLVKPPAELTEEQEKLTAPMVPDKLKEPPEGVSDSEQIYERMMKVKNDKTDGSSEMSDVDLFG